jgi:hypothetical protein
MRLAIQQRVSSADRKFRVLPVILPGGERAKESDLPGFLQGTTWVEFANTIDEGSLHRLECGIKGIRPGRGIIIQLGDCPYVGLHLNLQGISLISKKLGSVGGVGGAMDRAGSCWRSSAPCCVLDVTNRGPIAYGGITDESDPSGSLRPSGPCEPLAFWA